MVARVNKNPHKAHNWMFSRCSRKAMARVIADDSTTWCFKARSSSYCGNAVVEPGEECDCGTTYTCEAYDACCVPLSLQPGFRRELACKLKDIASCSPRVQRCCTSECAVTGAGVTCREKTECSSSSLCDGQSSSCPAPQLADEGTPCAGGRGQCNAGVCSVSPC